MAFNVLLMSVETVFAADGVLGFLVAWELMSLATAALVATDHESRPSRRSAFLYLAMSHLGTGCLVAGLYHVLNHAAFKGLLFLGASGVIAATGTRRIEELGGLAHRPRTAGLFLLGSAAIAGLPLLNGFASEWLVFQALLHGFFFAERLTRIVLPLGGALLALTSALAAACFVKAFALTFLARPRSRAAAEATESPALLLAPQAFLAAVCVALGLFPGLVVRVLAGVAASLPGIGPQAAFTGGLAGVTVGAPAFDHLSPFVLAPAAVLGLGLAVALGLVSARVPRRAPAWGCGGELSAETEYTATAFAKTLVMVFRGIYRPTREVSTVETAPYFASEVRYRSEIGAPFERHVYGPATRAVLAAAGRLRVIQAGSLHAYLACVLALGVILLWWLGGLP